MGINFNEINKYKGQIEFDKNRSDKALTVSNINEVNKPLNNARVSMDEPKKNEYEDNGFEEVFDQALEPYRQQKK